LVNYTINPYPSKMKAQAQIIEKERIPKERTKDQTSIAKKKNQKFKI
jgi:hypothetical protein